MSDKSHCLALSDNKDYFSGYSDLFTSTAVALNLFIRNLAPMLFNTPNPVPGAPSPVSTIPVISKDHACNHANQ